LRRHFSILAFLTALSVVGSSGGFVFGAQLFAWATMAHSFLKAGSSPKTAVSKTLDGRHPCKLCKKLNRHHLSDAKEEKNLPSSPRRGPDLRAEEALTPGRVEGLEFNSEAYFKVKFSQFEIAVPTSFSHSPPTPPPRVG